MSAIFEDYIYKDVLRSFLKSTQQSLQLWALMPIPYAGSQTYLLISLRLNTEPFSIPTERSLPGLSDLW